MAVEEGLLAEDHAGEHAAQGPHVQPVVVVLQVHQQLRPFEVPAGHPHVVLFARMVELSQAPVNEAQLLLLMIDHHIVWLHISVHDPLGVAEVQRLQQLVDIEPDVVVRERLIQHLEVGVVDILKNEAGSLRLRVADNVQQLNDVRTATEVLQYLDLPLDLLLFDRLQDLDYALLIVDVHTLEHLAVLSPAYFPHHLIIVLAPPLQLHVLIVPILLGLMNVDIRIHTRSAH
mmetsp:Transcript_2849/g.8330  ORF Transcript_2849/g.8330 Transcript_2849/m.8330 type:complete len:231 (+) Transcript_2849:733-1425(+)